MFRIYKKKIINNNQCRAHKLYFNEKKSDCETFSFILCHINVTDN